MFIFAYFWLALGLVFEIANLYLYSIGIWNLSRLKPGEKRPYIPSAVPFVSLPLYLIYCLLIPIAYHSRREPVPPMPFELKLGLVIIAVHIVWHLLAISILRRLYNRVES